MIEYETEFNLRYVAEAAEKGLTIISEGTYPKYLYRRNVCGHIFEANPSSIRHNKCSTCAECTRINLQEAEIKFGLTFIEKISNIKNRYRIESCGHHIELYKANIVKQEFVKCPICEAFARPLNLKGPLGAALIPPHIMSSVALDLFHMPFVRWEGENFDIMAVCVDRMSGWIVAVPALNKGLTGAKVAKQMLKYHWRPFGIPSIISSDQGSHFTGGWWKTMCARLGIRQSFSQAYHHQANGRAEMAGQQLMERIRKIQIQEKIPWVESLPYIVDRIHDTPGETGFYPFQILFGRDRPLASIPYSPHKDCEDAQLF